MDNNWSYLHPHQLINISKWHFHAYYILTGWRVLVIHVLIAIQLLRDSTVTPLCVGLTMNQSKQSLYRRWLCGAKNSCCCVHQTGEHPAVSPLELPANVGVVISKILDPISLWLPDLQILKSARTCLLSVDAFSQKRCTSIWCVNN